MTDRSFRIELDTEPPEPTEKAVITALRAVRDQGSDPSTCRELLEFARAQEEQATKENSDEANIRVAIQLGRIYANAGYLEEALDELEKTREAAWNSGLHDLLSYIEELLAKIDERLSQVRASDPESTP